MVDAGRNGIGIGVANESRRVEREAGPGVLPAVPRTPNFLFS